MNMIDNNEDLYKSNIWSDYDNPVAIIRLTNDKTMINNNFLDGKAQRRHRRAKEIRKRKGRL